MTLTVFIMVEHNSIIFDLFFSLMLFPLYPLQSPSHSITPAIAHQQLHANYPHPSLSHSLMICYMLSLTFAIVNLLHALINFRYR